LCDLAVEIGYNTGLHTEPCLDVGGTGEGVDLPGDGVRYVRFCEEAVVPTALNAISTATSTTSPAPSRPP
jgi:hypothetical protein